MGFMSEPSMSWVMPLMEHIVIYLVKGNGYETAIYSFFY